MTLTYPPADFLGGNLREEGVSPGGYIHLPCTVTGSEVANDTGMLMRMLLLVVLLLLLMMIMMKAVVSLILYDVSGVKRASDTPMIVYARKNELSRRCTTKIEE